MEAVMSDVKQLVAEAVTAIGAHSAEYGHARDKGLIAIVDRLVDALEATVSGNDREALIAAIYGTPTPRGVTSPSEWPFPVSVTELADAVLAAGFRRSPEPQQAPPPEEWAAQMDVERQRQIEHGYDDAHDRETSVEHLLTWAIDYARRGKTLAVSTMIREAVRRLAEPQQVSTGECNCGYGGFHEPLNVNCRLYRPEGGEQPEATAAFDRMFPEVMGAVDGLTIRGEKGAGE